MSEGGGARRSGRTATNARVLGILRPGTAKVRYLSPSGEVGQRNPGSYELCNPIFLFPVNT